MVVRSWIVACAAALVLAGCGGGEVTKVMSVEDRFAHARRRSSRRGAISKR